MDQELPPAVPPPPQFTPPRPPPPRPTRSSSALWITLALLLGIGLGGTCATCATLGGLGGEEVFFAGRERVGVVELLGPIADGEEVVKNIRKFAMRDDLIAL